MGGEKERERAKHRQTFSSLSPRSFVFRLGRKHAQELGGREGNGGEESGVFTRGSRTHDEQERDTGCESYITSRQAVASASCATCIEA